MNTPELMDFPEGGYHFLKGGFPYSQGVKAGKGYSIERARFVSPLSLIQGFGAIEKHLAAMGRPRTALCAAELRSPKPFSMGGFGEFNKTYVDVLKEWGLYRDGLNPVARSNVTPEIAPLVEPSFYAFCYTVPSVEAEQTFIVAGSGEWPEGGSFPDDIVAREDLSAAGLRSKARFVLDTMERRFKAFGANWSDVTASQVYTVHDFHPFLGDEIVSRTRNGGGLTWHYCRPPIEGLEFEMDVRSVTTERVINLGSRL
ncbi:MAG: hypothetical protein EXR36_10535 [Betaproteobacteria bacterium]|nr:hypothetical protein [Betaproteobacteria bacterium]